MGIDDRISRLIWDSEAETVVGVPPRGQDKPKSRTEPSSKGDPEPELPKPEEDPTRHRPETVYYEPEEEPAIDVAEPGKS